MLKVESAFIGLIVAVERQDSRPDSVTTRKLGKRSKKIFNIW